MSFQIVPGYVLSRHARSLDEAPDVPSIWDDEFDSDTLDPKWTRFGGPYDDVTPIDPYAAVATARTSLNGFRPSWWMVQPPGPGVVRLVQDITVPDICFMWARMSFSARWNAMGNNESTAHLSLCGASGADRDLNFRVYIYMNESDGNTVQVQGGQVIGGADTNTAMRNLGPQAAGTDTKIQHACYIGIQKILTTYITCVGWPNGHWMTVSSHSLANVFTRISLEFQNVSNVAPGSLVHGVDFFRIADYRRQP